MRKPADLIRDILHAGLRAILVVVAIEVIVCLIAVSVGTVVFFTHGFLASLLSGIATFVIGQPLAELILDMTSLLPEHPSDKESNLSDEQALKALRTELETAASEEKSKTQGTTERL